MSFFEQYRMNIPIIAPTLEFLTRLHMEHYLVYDKTLLNKVRQNGSALSCHPAYTGSSRVLLFTNSNGSSDRSPSRVVTLDPNNDSDARAVRHWLSLADYYTFPHVLHFHSAEQLVDLLHSMTLDNARVEDSRGNNRWKSLRAVSEAMRVENRAQLKRLLRYWRTRLLDIAQHSPNAPF